MLLEDFSDEQDFDYEERINQRLKDMEQLEFDDQPEDQKEEDKFLDAEEARGKLHLWISEQRTYRWIYKTFKNFLLKYRDKKNNSKLIYDEKIAEMAQQNKQSLYVSLEHLKEMNATLFVWICYEPTLIIKFLNKVAMDCTLLKYPDYKDMINNQIYVKFVDFSVMDNIRDLRQKDLGQLIKIQGVVTKRSKVFSQLDKVYYICRRCGDRKGPIYQNEESEQKIGDCAVCQSKGPFEIDQAATLYQNYQRITIQESPNQVPPGRVPRQKEVILLGDNIDIARPGDEIQVTGIYTMQYDYKLNRAHGFPIFTTFIEANYVKCLAEIENIDLPKEDIQQIKELSKDKNIGQRIISSIAPSIFEHRDVKTALALAMFGGEAKDIAGKHRIRGDINVLVLGDPGTAKSQFLKSVEKLFHRCIYTTGKGASAVGLTAGVHKDPVTQEWTLEGGALVLADKGICVIDEFDKMSDQDRTSIHEAMEQQSISISKAGIVASLQARCSVIAAANPIQGRYNSQLSFMDNVELSDPILSRFDILCVVKDRVDFNLDSKLASFVINSHIKNHPSNKEKSEQELESNLIPIIQDQSIKPLDQTILRKYIMYAR